MASGFPHLDGDNRCGQALPTVASDRLLVFLSIVGLLLRFEGCVCNGETSPLDGRNDSGTAAQPDAAAQDTALASVRWSPATAGDLPRCHRVEMPHRCPPSPTSAPSTTLRAPARTGEWHLGMETGDASVRQHRQHLGNGQNSHLYHLCPHPLVLREGNPKYPALLRVTCFLWLPPHLTD